MLVLLPFLILSLGISAGICSALGLSGLTEAAAFIGLFLLCFLGTQLLFILITALIALPVNPAKPQLRRSRFFCGYVTYGLGWLCTLMRLNIHVTGREKLPEGRFLLVCNHRSAFDPIVTGWALRDCDLAFISKPQNMKLPVVGKMTHKACYLAIDRENDREALKCILAAADMIGRDVRSVAVYPEGTRSRTGELLPFRNGAFKIAQKAKSSIVVAMIRGTETVKKHTPWKRTDVYLDILTVIDAETVQNSKTSEIGDEVRTWITSAGC